MILINNRRGGWLLIIGLGIGLATYVSFHIIWVALATTGLVWLIWGWPRRDAETGKREFYPHVYFVPIPAWGLIAIALATFWVIVVTDPGTGSNRRAPDPLQAMLDADVRALKNVRIAGDERLSNTVFDAVRQMPYEGLGIDGLGVKTRVRDGATLVLVRLPMLKESDMTSRSELLDAVERAAASDRRVDPKRLYVGVRGSYVFGAIQTPKAGRNVGKVVSDDPLLAFYAVNRAAATPAPTTRTAVPKSE